MQHTLFMVMILFIKTVLSRGVIMSRFPKLGVILSFLLISFVCEAEKMDPRITYHTDVVEKKLNQAEDYLKQNKFKFAEQQLVSAQNKLDTIYKDYAGKFDVNHPLMLDFKKRIDYLKSKFTVNVTANPTPHEKNPITNTQITSDISPVIDAINLMLPKVLDAVKEARFAVMALNSIEADYSQYRNQNKLKSVLDNLQNKLTSINALLPNAEQLTHSFRSQYPTQESLEAAFPKQAYNLDVRIKSLENNIFAWKMNRDRVVIGLVSAALLSINEANISLESIDVSNKVKLSVAIGHIQMWTVNYYGYLMDAVAIVYPTVTENRPEGLIMSVENINMLADAKKFYTQLHQLELKIAQINNQNQIAIQEKVKNARFPSDVQPIGHDRSMVTQLLTQFFGVKPERLAIYAPWEETTVAKWIKGIWNIETYKYLGVWMLKRNESGKYFVYQVTVRHKKMNDGNWGPMHYWTIGSSYEILEQNIHL